MSDHQFSPGGPQDPWGMRTAAGGDGQLAPSLIVEPGRNDFRRLARRMGEPDFYGGHEALGPSQQLLLEGCRDIRSVLDAAPIQGRKPLRVSLAQVTLHEARVARSYRPIETFTRDSCPFIGETDGLGKFLVLVTPNGLDRLEERITTPRNDEAAAHLTSIASFAPLDDRYRLTLPMERAIRRQLERDGAVRVKVRLPRFELFTPLYQQELEATFLGMEGVHNAPYLALGNFLVYGADIADFEQVARIAAQPFIDRVEVMPRYRPTQIAFSSDSSEPQGQLVRLGPIPDDLPTIVVADAGLPNDGPLAPLVCERASFVDGPLDPAHAAAVASQATAQRDILPSGVLIPRNRLVDVRIFASADEEVLEEELIARINAAVRQFGRTWKVWNASIAAVPGPRPQRYSDLGQRLDELRHEYGLMFVCAAGNRPVTDLRAVFPPITNDDDWISAPGDGLRNLTVTSLAPEDGLVDAFARPHEPSPFSSRGLSPAGALLPLIAEYGGNVGRSGQLLGIQALGADGRLCRVAGSSMAAPLVSGTLAELEQCFARSLPARGVVSDADGEVSSLLLAKAAVLHRADIPSVMAGDANLAEYYGFGVPPGLDELTGDPYWQGTTYIAATLLPNGEDLLVDPFPFPDGLCLGGFWRGDILVTLVTEPLLVSGETLEYVRSDVDLKFGPAEDDADGEVHIRPNKLLLDAQEPPARYESELIRREQKWSPFRRYRVRLSPPGIKAKRWGLHARLRLRADEAEEVRVARNDHRHLRRYLDMVELYGVQIVVAVTILDPHRAVPVRDQMLRQWQIRGDIPAQIAIAQRVRSRFILQ